MDTLTIALWATHTGHPVASATEWLALVDQKCAEAKAEHAHLLMLPEHVAEHWLHFAPRDIPPTEQLDWFADLSDDMLSAMSVMAAKHDIILVAGTWGVRLREGRFANRCHILHPDGRIDHQDKLCLTPRENNPEGWQLSTGDTLRIFGIHGYRVAVTICLDVELPALSALLAQHKPDLLLCPSMTKMMSGYSRVFGCAKARAVELQCAVAVTGVIGNPPGRLPNTAGCAVYLPCEEAFGHTGIHAEIAPSDTVIGPGPLLVARDVPLAAIRAHRARAEVWPGAWSAQDVSITG